MPVVEQAGLRIGRWPLPLSEAAALAFVESSACVAQRAAVEVVESNRGHPLQEATAVPDTGFEAAEDSGCEVARTEEWVERLQT